MSTLAEEMAIAVLKGDIVAARGLADLLTETVNAEAKLQSPVLYELEHPFNPNKCWMIVYISDWALENVNLNVADMEDQIRHWIIDGGPLLAFGIKKIEIYEVKKDG